jgi:hypothetical protein
MVVDRFIEYISTVITELYPHHIRDSTILYEQLDGKLIAVRSN